MLDHREQLGRNAFRLVESAQLIEEVGDRGGIVRQRLVDRAQQTIDIGLASQKSLKSRADIPHNRKET
jgi:hypothetical protein